MKVLTDAEALKAEVVVTGDKTLKKMSEYMGIKILIPQQFLRT
jgi:predicted nucleic acid-binding protein